MLSLFKRNPVAFGLAIILHILILFFLLFGLDWIDKPKPATPKVAVVQAHVVDGAKHEAEEKRLKQALAEKEAAKEAAEGTLLSNASSAIPKIVEQVNNARMIKAITEGKVPPPPISLQGENFTEWAMNAAIEDLREKQQREVTEAQKRELRLMIQGLQNEMVKQVPPDYPMRPMPEVPTQVQAQQAAVKERNQLTQTLLAAAIPTVGFLLFK